MSKSCVTRKPVLGVSDKVQTKPGHEILDLEVEGWYNMYSGKKDVQLICTFVFAYA